MCDISKNFNILIFGHNGWIGSQVIKLLDKMKIKYIKACSRADNYQNIENEIKIYGDITHIYSFIGRTHGIYDNQKINTIDYLEKSGTLKDNINDNLYAPFCLATIAKKYDIHLTYLGTGCIFNGNEEYTEENEPDFFGSNYSVVKGITDKMMHLFNNVLNCRIRMPITDENHERNFITKLVNYKQICSIPNSMSVLDDLLPVLIDMSLQYKTGTINLVNPGLISHNDILEMYKQIINPYLSWNNISIEEQSKLIACERSNNHLDTTKLLSLYPNIMNIKTSVYNTLIRMQNKMVINLLVTGGCGFIGSNFINKYFYTNTIANIINIDAMYYCADENNINDDIKKSDRYTFIKGNLCSYNLLELLHKYNITHVIHFAAQSHVQNSFNDAIQYTHDNILGTHTLLEACRKYDKLKLFIHVSTDEVYGYSLLTDIHKKTENNILCPTNPYAASKAAAEMIVNSYYHSFKLPIIITRGNNVYGKNQYPEKLIPKFIKLLKENKKLTIQGDGSQLRSFLHIDDVINAFICILHKGLIGEIYNIGASEDDEYSVLEIAQKLIRIIKNTCNYNEWITYIDDRPFNDIRYFIDNNKLVKLGWQQTININKGLLSFVWEQSIDNNKGLLSFVC
jgi:dTDP-glucose 4,6-dehydratase